MFQFQYKDAVWFFAAVGFIVLLFILVLSWKKNTIRKIGDEHLVKELVKGYSQRLFIAKFILICLAFAVGIVAVMNPRKPGEGAGVNRKGIDVAIALDVSKSMLATDLQPNRLQTARNFIYKLMDGMPNDRIALILFAGRAYMQMPLTTDHNAAKMFVQTADPMTMSQPGTALSDAMRVSAYAFNNMERRFKTVVLMSDGEDHDPASLEAAEEMSSQGIMVNTVGIGSPTGAPIVDPTTGTQKLDASGNVVISKLNEEHLKQIATTTNGIYIHLNEPDIALKQLSDHLGQIEKKAFTDLSLVNYRSYYWWFAFAMLLLLFAEFFLPEKKPVLR